ncbi:MAG: glycosyltransferase, partial [Rhizomicrobium sp.]
MADAVLLGFLPLAIWLYLLLARRGFWLLRERDSLAVAEPQAWPSVTAIVPARNEADVIARSLESLIAQDYPGAFRIILVDDQSSDETAAIAQAFSSRRLAVMTASARPAGWTGKLWAMQQGILQVGTTDFLWFTDADIAHAPDNLRRLVARAEEGQRVLVSLMARLQCETWAERLMIPAFVFFFSMLFPFAAVNDAKSGVAAAAGGCMLARREALARAGGLERIRHHIIDDCAMARLLKGHGPVW